MAGYTTIEIAGQQVGLRFGLAALKMAAQKKAIKIVGEEIEIPDTLSTSRYLHCAYVENCLVKEIDGDIAFEQFVEFVEMDMLTGGGEMVRIGQIITENVFVKPKEPVPGEEVKKKVTKKKLTGTK